MVKSGRWQLASCFTDSRHGKYISASTLDQARVGSLMAIWCIQILKKSAPNGIYCHYNESVDEGEY
jgi:hypothetical protein